MRSWTPEQVASAAGARLIAPPPTHEGPRHVVIDSRQATDRALFVGLAGANTHGGVHAPQALATGAWGVLTTPQHAEAAKCAQPGVLLAAEDPLKALQDLANAYRNRLGAKVIGVTGSTGKTSTKDILKALISPQRRTAASTANFNTEIGLPLEVLNAPEDSEVLILEMAMRGSGQIAELAQIAEPDVGVIVNVGPVHLEIMKTIEAIAAAKAELIAALKPGGTAVIPAAEPLLEPHRRTDINTITFGESGDVRLSGADNHHLQIDAAGTPITLEVDFTESHLRRNLLAATAAALAIGVTPRGQIMLERSPGRGQRTVLSSDVTLIDDCYNANPMSMRAALDELAATAERVNAPRKLAVLGDMLELGPGERAFHEQIGAHASAVGVDVLVTVGRLAASIADTFDGGASYPVADAAEAAALVSELVEPGDLVLVKASRGVGLEVVCESLKAAA
jgi:UDP-N-acetylmuramoyl-tripeptide--D-alanyl-D-alanine ligase